MATYNRPGIYVEEASKLDKPIGGVGTSATAFLGLSDWGPADVPLKMRSYADAKKAFGEPSKLEPLLYSLKGYFDNGGTEAYVNRLVHYSDATDKSTGTGAVAVRTLLGIGQAAPAQTVGTAAPTYKLTDGDHLDIDVNNAGAAVATFNAKAGIYKPAAGSFAGGDSGSATIVVSGVSQFIDLTGYAGAATAAGYVTALNALLEGCYVFDDGGDLSIVTDQEGSGATIVITGMAGNWAAKVGLVDTAGPNNAGPNDAVDADAVTFAEIKTLVEGDIANITLTQQGSTNYIVITEDVTTTPFTTSEIDIGVASTAAMLTALGLSVGVDVDTLAAQGNAAKAWGGYRGYKCPGTRGNNLSVSAVINPLFPSAKEGDALKADLALEAASASVQLTLVQSTGIRVNSVLRLKDGATEQFVRVKSVTVTPGASSVSHVVELFDALTATFPVATTQVKSYEFDLNVYESDALVETFTQLSMNPLDTDLYALNVINDKTVGSAFIYYEDLGLAFPLYVMEDTSGTLALTSGSNEKTGFIAADLLGDATAKTGIHAFDGTTGISLITAVQSASTSSFLTATGPIQSKILAYAESRADLFAILDLPEGYGAAQAVVYRNETLGMDSKWGALYNSFLDVPDADAPAGSTAVATVPCVGHVAGLYARVDQISPPEGGVASAAAGTGNFGLLKGVVDLDFSASDSEQDTMNPAGVNCLRKFTNELGRDVIVVFGARTLSTDKKWRYIPVRRTMTYAQQSIKLGTRWAIFRNNDYRTWGKLKDRIEAFLRKMLADGQLLGQNQEEAFFVIADATVTTPSDVDNGQLNVKIGLALQRPAEFIIYTFSQHQGGADINEG